MGEIIDRAPGPMAAQPAGGEPGAPTPNLARELALLGLLALLWGSSYLFIKLALVSIPPLTLMASRSAIAALLLVLVVIHRGDALPRDARTWRQLFVQAAFIAMLAWIVLAWGQQFVDSSLAGVLNSTSPIFVFFITALWTRHEPLSWRKLGGALLGVFGVAMIVGPDALRGLGDQVLAQLAILLGAAFYACAAVYGRRFAHLPATVTSAGVMLWASLGLVPLSLALERPWTLSPTPGSLWAAAALAVLCTTAALLIYFRMIRTLGSMGAASQAYLRAGVAVLLGIVILGEQPSWYVAVGLLATIAGVALINLPAGRKRHPSA